MFELILTEFELNNFFLLLLNKPKIDSSAMNFNFISEKDFQGPKNIVQEFRKLLSYTLILKFSTKILDHFDSFDT